MVVASTPCLTPSSYAPIQYFVSHTWFFLRSGVSRDNALVSICNSQNMYFIDRVINLQLFLSPFSFVRIHESNAVAVNFFFLVFSTSRDAVDTRCIKSTSAKLKARKQRQCGPPIFYPLCLPKPAHECRTVGDEQGDKGYPLAPKLPPFVTLCLFSGLIHLPRLTYFVLDSFLSRCPFSQMTLPEQTHLMI